MGRYWSSPRQSHARECHRGQQPLICSGVMIVCHVSLGCYCLRPSNAIACVFFWYVLRGARLSCARTTIVSESFIFVSYAGPAFVAECTCRIWHGTSLDRRYQFNLRCLHVYLSRLSSWSSRS